MSMEGSSRGVKRKEAPATPTPRNSPQKEAVTPSPSVWGKAVPSLTHLFGVEVKATTQVGVEVKEEGVVKKQKLSEKVAVATQTPHPSAAPLSFITPTVKRVARTTWKRINDAAFLAPSSGKPPLPPPSPALRAINSVAERKKRVVVTKKEKEAAAAPTPATSPSASASTPSPTSPSSPAVPAVPLPPPSPRTVAHRLAQRRKQLELGKRTVGYLNYTAAVPRQERQEGLHPNTPQPKKACSKRSWDGQVRKWRRELHKWDPEGKGKDEEGEGEEGESELGSELGGRAEEAEEVEPAVAQPMQTSERSEIVAVVRETEMVV